MQQLTAAEQLRLNISAATPLVWVQAYEETVVIDAIHRTAATSIVSGVYNHVWVWNTNTGLTSQLTAFTDVAITETKFVNCVSLCSGQASGFPGNNNSCALEINRAMSTVVTTKFLDLLTVLRIFYAFMALPEPAVDPSKQTAKERNAGRRTDTLVITDAAMNVSGERNYQIQRLMHDIAVAARDTPRSVRLVLLDTVYNPPARMDRFITHIKWPLPSRTELSELVRGIITAQEIELASPETTIDGMTEALSGLTVAEATRVCQTSIVRTKTLDPAAAVVEKANIIAKSGVLSFMEPFGDLDQIGGLENLKEWLRLRRRAFSSDAAEYGLRSPRGAVLVGVPGTGKSLTARCIGTAWSMPVIQLDIGALMGSLVGESEQRLRQALATAEAVAPAVLAIDEFEKMWGGAGSERDSGTSSRMFGSFLTWLNDHTSPVFSLLMGNSVDRIPPEFLRAGRFDGMFFTDLPNLDERAAILRIQLENRKRDPNNFDIEQLAYGLNNFSGAEISQVIEMAMYSAYADNRREVATNDILAAIPHVSRVITSTPEKIQAIRSWGKTHAIPASADLTRAAQERMAPAAVRQKPTLVLPASLTRK